jgi:hypothetical protein
MAVIRITRYESDASVEELIERRTALISAVRAAFPGLTETRFARTGDRSWVDVWRWDNAEHAAAAVAAAPALPETRAAFALVIEPTAEQAEIVDED